MFATFINADVTLLLSQPTNASSSQGPPGPCLVEALQRQSCLRLSAGVAAWCRARWSLPAPAPVRRPSTYVASGIWRTFALFGERPGSSAATTRRDHTSTASCTARRGPERGCSHPRRLLGDSTKRCSTQTANSEHAKRRIS